MNQRELSPACSASVKPRRLKMGYAATDKPGVDVPFLRLRGQWLKVAGFDIGRNVTIDVSEGRLLIETID
jgi:hypothetical protein